jgi:hypothetical protein
MRVSNALIAVLAALPAFAAAFAPTRTTVVCICYKQCLWPVIYCTLDLFLTVPVILHLIHFAHPLAFTHSASNTFGIQPCYLYTVVTSQYYSESQYSIDGTYKHLLILFLPFSFSHLFQPCHC